MRKNQSILSLKLLFAALICVSLSACIGTAVGVVVDTAIEVVKIPVKVAGAVVDMAVPDRPEKEDKFHLKLNDPALSDEPKALSDEPKALSDEPTAVSDEPTALSDGSSDVNIGLDADSNDPGADNK